MNEAYIYTTHLCANEVWYFVGAYIDLTSAIDYHRSSFDMIKDSISKRQGDHISLVGPIDKIPPSENEYMSLTKSPRAGEIVWSQRIIVKELITSTTSYMVVRKTPLNGSPLLALAEQADLDLDG